MSALGDALSSLPDGLIPRVAAAAAAAPTAVPAVRFLDESIPQPGHLWVPPNVNDLCGRLHPLRDSGVSILQYSTDAPTNYAGSCYSPGVSTPTNAHLEMYANHLGNSFPTRTGFSGSFSAIVWWKKTSLANGDRILCFGNSGGSSYYVLSAWNDGNVYLQTNDGTGRTATSTGTSTLGWHMAYVEITDGSHIGLSVDAETLITTALGTTINTAANTFLLGYDAGDTYAMDGYISTTALWPTQLLTADNRTALYDSGNGAALIGVL